MLFLAKQHARTALLVMLGLLIVSNAWAGVRGIALNDAVTLDLVSVVSIALGLTLSASIDSVIFLASWIIGFHPFLDSFKAGYARLFGHVGIPAIFAGGLLAALGEETFFRGILQREWGILPAAVLFALAHVGRGLKIFTVWALLEGLVFGWLYQLTGNLLVPMIVHGMHDSAGMFFGRYLYGRFIPPAATLSDWLHILSEPAEPAASAPATQALSEPAAQEAPRILEPEMVEPEPLHE